MSAITPFELQQDTAEATACGPGDSFCSRALGSDFETTMRSDPCSIQTQASDDEKTSNYQFYRPKYLSRPSEGSGYITADTGATRFGPKKVAQESFLQGRGQVTGPRGCFASGMKFLPEDLFEEAPPKKGCHDMTLYSRSTQTKKSCGSLSEIDMSVRLRPLPGQYAGAFIPNIMSNESLVPNVTDTIGGAGGVTLSNKKYPSWEELRAKQDSYK
jgi:hypothetical protein